MIRSQESRASTEQSELYRVRPAAHGPQGYCHNQRRWPRRGPLEVQHLPTADADHQHDVEQTEADDPEGSGVVGLPAGFWTSLMPTY